MGRGPVTASKRYSSSTSGQGTPRSQWGRAVPVVAVLFLAALATACGNGSVAPGVASVGSSPTSTSQAAVAAPVTTLPTPASAAALAACFRKQGLTNFPDPPYADGELNRLGFTKQVVEKYENGACRKDALAAGVVQTPAENQQHLEQMLRIAKCMRAHGIVNFPDPNSQGTFLMSPSLADEPGYSAAAKVCGG